MGTVLTVWMMISDSAFEKVSAAAAACRLRGAVIAGFVAFTPAWPAATKLGRINEHITARVLMLGLAASEADVCLVAGRFQAATRTVRELNCRLRHSNAVRIELRA